MRGMQRLVVAVFLSVLCASTFGAPVYIQGVPDWDQPVLAGPPPNLNTGWNAWCVPTATANIVGYYRDLIGNDRIGDGQVFPNTAAWNAPASDYQDDTADPASEDPILIPVARTDIGWYMNTNDAGQSAIGPFNYIGTMFTDIKPGLDGIRPAVPGWKGYFPDNGVSVTVTNASDNSAQYAPLNTAPGGPFTQATVWPRITTEIDAGRPVLISFSHWGLQPRNVVRDNGPVELPDYDSTLWGNNPQSNPGTGESYTNPDIGHTVTLVGYWLGSDPTNPFYDNDTQTGPDAIIVHDCDDGYLPGGPLPLVLPFNMPGCPWVMNTEITIPEPASVTLAFVGGGLLLALRRRRQG